MRKHNRFIYLYYLIEKNSLKILNFSGTTIMIDFFILVNTLVLALQGLIDE